MSWFGRAIHVNEVNVYARRSFSQSTNETTTKLVISGTEQQDTREKERQWWRWQTDPQDIIFRWEDGVKGFSVGGNCKSHFNANTS